MATLTIPSRAHHHTGMFDTAWTATRAFFRGVREGMEMADAYHALSRMSDVELAKRGLTRPEIARAVALGYKRA